MITYLVVGFLLPWSIQAACDKLNNDVFKISSHELLVQILSNNKNKSMTWNIDNYLNGVFIKNSKSISVMYDKKMPSKISLYQWETAKTDTITHLINIKISRDPKCDSVQLHFDQTAMEKWNSTFQWLSQTETIYANKFTNVIGLALYLKPLSLFPKFTYLPTKEKYYIYITKYNWMTALSNCKTSDPKGCYKDVDLSKSLTRNKDCFEATPEMPSYSAAIVAYTDITSVSVQYDSHKLLIWANKDQIKNIDFAKSKSVELLKALEALTGIPYFNIGLAKLDQVAVSDYPVSAMEHWGLIVYRETALIYDTSYSTTKNKQQVLQIIANQFTHMWFGYYLRPKHFQWVWLDEGFSRYMEYFVTNIEEADKQFVVEELQEIMTEDDLSHAAALNEIISSRDDIISKYGNLSERKGACLLRMLRYLVGEESFKKGIKTYLNTVKGTTSPGQLWNTFKSAQQNLDTKNVMDAFASLPGYPVVKVSLVDNKLVFMQEAFSYTVDNDKKQLWKIPVTYDIFSSSSQVTKGFLLLDAETKTIDVSASAIEFVIVNPDQRAYFRTHYEESLFNKIIDTLQSDKMESIDEISRAHLVDDAFSMSRAKLMKYEDLFRMLPYFANETSYFPWFSALRGLKYFRDRLDDEDYHANFDKIILDWLDPVYANISDKRSTDIEKMREEMLYHAACAVKRPECLDEAKKEFQDNFPKPIVPTEHTLTAYKTMIENDEDDSTWDKLWEQYEISKSPLERIIILKSLASSNHPDKLKELLDKALDNGITAGGMVTVINSIAENSLDGPHTIIDFVGDNYKEISKKLENRNLNDILTTIAEKAKTEEERKKVDELIKDDDFLEEWNISDEKEHEILAIIARNKQWAVDNADFVETLLGGVDSFHGASLFLVVLNVFWCIIRKKIV